MNQNTAKLLQNLKDNGMSGEIFSIDSREMKMEFKGDKLWGCRDNQSSGKAIRAAKDGKVCFLTRNILDSPEEIVSEAKELIPFGQPFTWQWPADKSDPLEGIYNPEINNISFDSLVKLGEEAVKQMKSEVPEASVDFSASRDTSKTEISNTEGLDETFQDTSMSLSVTGKIAEEGNILWWASFNLSYGAIDNIDGLVEKTVDVLRQARQNVEPIKGKVPVILSPDAVSSVMTALKTGINGRKIVQGTSPLKDRIGEAILDPRITVREVPRNIELAGAQPFDDEGVPLKDGFIVENGVLRRYMLDLYTAGSLGLAPTGNGCRSAMMAGRTHDAMPSPGAQSWYMEGGDSTLEELMTEAGDAILIHFTPDVFQGDLTNGDFSGSIYMGLLVKNGKIAGRVKNLQFSGNLYELLGDQLVGMTRDVYRPSLGAGARYPWVLAKDVSVS